MVSPLAAGALAITLQPGIPTLLTEYAAGPEAPLTIINLSTGQLVYVAADSGLNTNNAVPIPPGTNVPWMAPGQVWGLVPADGAATTVAITGAVGSLPGVPTPQPSSDTWSLTASHLAGGTYNLTNSVPGLMWGSTYAYTTATISGGGNVGVTVNLVQASINNTIALASGLTPLNTGTTIGLPKVPYVAQVVVPSAGISGTLSVAVSLSPT